MCACMYVCMYVCTCVMHKYVKYYVCMCVFLYWCAYNIYVCIYACINSFIMQISIAPLQGDYSGTLPIPARLKSTVFK